MDRQLLGRYLIQKGINISLMLFVLNNIGGLNEKNKLTELHQIIELVNRVKKTITP